MTQVAGTDKAAEVNRAAGPAPGTPFDWTQAFEFTHLFKAFRLAIHPAKLMIALLAITLIYSAGRAFDAVWGPRVFKGEIEEYQFDTPERFRQSRDMFVRDQGSNLRHEMEDFDVPSAVVENSTSPDRAKAVLKAAYLKKYQQDREDAATLRKQREQDRARENSGAGALDTYARESPAELERSDRSKAAATLQQNMDRLGDLAGRGVFDSFMKYELNQLDRLAENALSVVRISPVRPEGADAGDRFGGATDESALSGGLFAKDPKRLWRSDTVTGCLLNTFVTGPAWLFAGAEPAQGDYRDTSLMRWAKRLGYWLTLLLFAAFSLAVTALAGGTICRMAAVEFAGREPVGLQRALAFSRQMFWSFVKTPLTPFAIVLGAGFVLSLFALLGAIPGVGEILIGAGFIVFLAGGFILMLMVLGVIGGFNLMYPTIAVEGSDSFDAISRSFSYVYARPWRMAFYSIISLVYGVLTYLFVAFAVYLMLAITHLFTGWGVNAFGAAHGWYTGQPKLDTLWPSPTYMDLSHHINWAAMNWSEEIGAILLHFWVFLVITLVGAYVVSFYFSSNTILYFLLRRSVDRQPLTDIYEEPAVDAGGEKVHGKTVTVIDAPTPAGVPGASV